MKAIVNVTENWGIGSENRLLVSISADLRRFRALTEGKTVVYGRKTLETFPGGKPLKNRRNIIMSTNRAFAVEGAEVVHDLWELFDTLRGVPTDEVFVIGGASVYSLLLPYCSEVLLTRTDVELPADRFFPNLDCMPSWKKANVSETFREGEIEFRYEDYVNLSFAGSHQRGEAKTDILGKWKTTEFYIATDDGIRVFTPDTLPSAEEYEMLATLAKALIEFMPDGTVNYLLPLPEDARELAQSQGLEYRDGFAVVDSTEWKEQGGTLYCEFGMECEETGTFTEITVLPDGRLLLSGFVLERI